MYYSMNKKFKPLFNNQIKIRINIKFELLIDIMFVTCLQFVLP